MKKNDELKKKNDAELLSLLAEKRGGLKNFYFGLAGSKIRNLQEAKMLRHEIAKIMTEISLRKRMN
jgi:ribosomal protein L29